MKEKTMRCPKFCAVMLLLSGLGSFLGLGAQLFECLVLSQNSLDFLSIAKNALSGSAALFVSIILFKKRYDKLLLGAIAGLVVSGLFSTIAYGITERSVSISVLIELMIFFVVLAFVFDLEKGKNFIIKARPAIPAITFICLMIDSIFISVNISEKISMDITMAIVLIAGVVFLPAVILYVAIYYKLVLWVIDPYEVNQKSKKKKVASR